MSAKERPEWMPDLTVKHPNNAEGQDASVTIKADAVKEAAARLYGQGYERKQIARIMVDHLVPNGKDRPLEQRLSQARTKLRNWEAQEKFRDMIYKLGLIKLDLQTPAILGGVAKKAKRGRVDAARLILEVTGRHNPKGDVAPTQVSLIVSGVPRPRVAASDGENTIEIESGDVVEEDDDV